ncbi:4703_t:CDS:2, partial [Gigaspora rosea]
TLHSETNENIDDEDVEIIKEATSEDPNTKAWTSGSLTGVDKLKVLQNFNLDLLFLNKDRAQLIRNLWNSFNKLYEDMHKQRVSGAEFKQKALDWINLFLTPSS